MLFTLVVCFYEMCVLIMSHVVINEEQIIVHGEQLYSNIWILQWTKICLKMELDGLDLAYVMVVDTGSISTSSVRADESVWQQPLLCRDNVTILL